MVEIIRGLVRPLMAVSSWVTILWMALNQQPVPDWLIALAATLSAFYFGDEAARRTNGGN